MSRLFMVDFRENGVSMHKCLEFGNAEGAPDAVLVAACQNYIGKGCVLDGVTEVLENMSAQELNEISLRPESLFLTRRPLYVNVTEVMRTVNLIRNMGG